MKDTIVWLADHIPLWLMVTIIIAFFLWQFIETAIRLRDNREEIACVAIKYDDIGIIALPAPARHHHVMWTRLFIDGKPTHSNGIQGFLTTHGRFVDRAKACKIAAKRDQIIHKHGSAAELYSEDMWATPPEARGYTITHEDD